VTLVVQCNAQRTGAASFFVRVQGFTLQAHVKHKKDKADGLTTFMGLPCA